MIKIIFNIFFAIVLVLGSIFLYGAFKNLDLENKTTQEKTEEIEVIKDKQEKKFERVIVEDWIDYKNDDYGFLIQYPQDWEVQEALKPQNLRAVHEIDIHQKEYDMTRAYLTIQIFDNSGKDDVTVWWEKWLGEEDQKEADCKAEYKDESPCLFLRGMVEGEKDSVIYDIPMKTITLFQFDSNKECNYIAYGKNIYGICYDSVNSNDPNFEANREITSKIFSSFIFNDLIREESTVAESSNKKDFEQYIVGSWKSTDDSKNIMAIKKEGIIENIYNGKVINTGTWIIDGYKLKTEIEDEKYEYTVVFAGSERLELTFLPRGNTLHFVRK